MQLLATQRDPVNTVNVVSTKSTPIPASGIYPRLQDPGTSSQTISQPRPLEGLKLLIF